MPYLLFLKKQQHLKLSSAVIIGGALRVKIMMISFTADGLDAMGLVITNCTAKRADSQPINSADPDTQLGTDGQLIIGENA